MFFVIFIITAATASATNPLNPSLLQRLLRRCYARFAISPSFFQLYKLCIRNCVACRHALRHPLLFQASGRKAAEVLCAFSEGLLLLLPPPPLTQLSPSFKTLSPARHTPAAHNNHMVHVAFCARFVTPTPGGTTPGPQTPNLKTKNYTPKPTPAKPQQPPHALCSTCGISSS